MKALMRRQTTRISYHDGIELLDLAGQVTLPGLAHGAHPGLRLPGIQMLAGGLRPVSRN
ncbi:hypothetical protein [Burkholderia sp. WAC0059]|uniref:hypothetical protein n=1 Tax=Burkholderia sp. WAC0059 TaxID=2066022 RepID=UPI0015E13002|nr:hypothetical protein [Burkholderia sp. WAC0059]